MFGRAFQSFLYASRLSPPPLWKVGDLESLQVSGKLPTYPSPKPTLTLISQLRQNVGLGEG